MLLSERLLPAIALFVLSAMCVLAIETSETLTVDGKSPSERLTFALSSIGSPDPDAPLKENYLGFKVILTRLPT